MSEISVENTIDIEETSEVGADGTCLSTFKLSSYDEDFVCIYFGDHYYVVNAEDLIAATRNATNINSS